MQPSDVQECVGIVAEHPAQRVRYGPMIRHLPAVWSRLLGQESFITSVFEMSDSDSGPRKTVAVGVSVFVGQDFVQRVKTPPLVWIGPELTRLVTKGRSPLLSNREVALANSGRGLTAVVWVGCVRPEHVGELQLHNLMVRAFIEAHSGFRLRELIAAQAESSEQGQAMLNSGGLFLDTRLGLYVSPSSEAVRNLPDKPNIFGISRDQAVRQTGSWISELFHEYHEPRIHFNRSQQRLLTAALTGDTDMQLAEALHLSLATVKTTWRIIYDRVGEHAPDILPASSLQEWAAERGKTKKYHLLSYLRSHPEELRPTTRKTN